MEREPGLRARPPCKQVRDAVGRIRAGLEHRADERPHHVPEEASAVIVKSTPVSVLLPACCEHGSHERVVPRLGQRERAEVVLAVEQQRGRLERTDVDRSRPQERTPRVERRPGRDDPIAIRPRTSREARMEVLRRRLRPRRRRRPPAAPRSAPPAPAPEAGLPRPERSRPDPSHAHRSRCVRRPRAPPSEETARRARRVALLRPCGGRAASPSRESPCRRIRASA